MIRIDPKAPKRVTVGRIEAREIGGKKVRADGSVLAFNRQGVLFLTRIAP